MMDFITKLYSYDNFTLYLTIAIVVLVILFIVILIFGKKDQKLEETKRLQKVSLEKDDAFKEENKAPEKLEVLDPEPEKKVIEDTTDKLPEDLDEVNVTVFEPTVKKTELASDLADWKEEFVKTNFEESPKASEVSPIHLNDIPEVKFDEISNSIDKELTELENIKNEFHDIKIPNTQVEEQVNASILEDNKSFQPSQVFSSVYVSENKEDFESNNDTQKEVTSINEEKNSEPVLIAQESNDDDLEFDLPVLKGDSKKDETSASDDQDNSSFNLDAVAGETYNLK